MRDENPSLANDAPRRCASLDGEKSTSTVAVGGKTVVGRREHISNSSNFQLDRVDIVHREGPQPPLPQWSGQRTHRSGTSGSLDLTRSVRLLLAINHAMTIGFSVDFHLHFCTLLKIVVPLLFLLLAAARWEFRRTHLSTLPAMART